MWNIVTIKGIILVVMFLITFVCSMLPIMFVKHIRETHDSNRRSRYQTLLSLMSCSAGGVFMGTCIMDLFPDVQEQLDVLMDQSFVMSSFPVAEFIVVFGFLLVLAMEQIVLDYKETSLLRGIALYSENTLSTSHETIGACFIHRRSDIIFEGLAVGLQGSIDDVVGLFLVVIFHKGIIAFSLGLNMVQSKLSVSQMLMANMFFCVTSPLGVGIGMGIMEMQASFTTAAISGSLQGIACGTFLYVTFFEVLPHEMNNGENRLLKLLFIIFGFSAVCGVLYLDPDTQHPRCFRQPIPMTPS
ncbi:Zinc transporter ZIP1-like 1 [Homarus americanus]|uniref:Zinc transporter ZIP1-like 1 n=1 Tax=Homarus americanus TaxID=6706 RepID=A0A8J5JJV1_HOMAM|nr:Zinc transporter ZIP1-like 1 [Homarus americanus]